MEYPAFKNSITNLVHAIQNVKLDYTKITEDSALNNMISNSTSQEKEESENYLRLTFQMLQINPKMDLIANWNHETFIQLSLDNNLSRPLHFLMDYLLEKANDPLFKSVLI